MKSKELFPAIFSRHAEAYDRRLDDIMRRHEARGRERALELLAPRPGMRILDLACGPGTLTARIAPSVRPGGSVVGVDLARGMIERARNAGIDGAAFAMMDVERLAFAGAAFDAAVCGHGLQFVPDLAGALAEVHRVLRPGAVFAASVPVIAQQDAVWGSLSQVIDRWLAPALDAPDRDRTRKILADREALAGTAQAAGFKSARVEAVDETTHWDSAAQLVALTSSWWDCASRLERTAPDRREAFLSEALASLNAMHPGSFETTGRCHVLSARA